MKFPALALAIGVAFFPAAPALAATTPAASAPATPTLAAPAPESRYLIRENHQDIHLMLDGNAAQVLLRDDGSLDSSGSSSYRATGSAMVGVCANAITDSGPVSRQLGIALNPRVFNLPEVQENHVPWLGFSTLGIGANDLSGAQSIPLSMRVEEKPLETSRVILWKQADLGVKPKVLLDSNAPSQSWDFPVNSHVHTNMLFTDPGHYRATFSYNPAFSGPVSGDTSYTLDFLVGAKAIATAQKDPNLSLTEQSTVLARGVSPCAETGNWEAYAPQESGTASKTTASNSADAPTTTVSSPTTTAAPGELPRAISSGLNGFNSALQQFTREADKFIQKNHPTTQATSRAPQTQPGRPPQQRQQTPGTATVAAPGQYPTPQAPRWGQAPAFPQPQPQPQPQSGGAVLGNSPAVVGNNSAPAFPSVSNSANVQPAPEEPATESNQARDSDIEQASMEGTLGAGGGFALGVGIMALIMGFAAFGVASKIG